ncbi:MAG TPA: hypothetical protein DCW29_03415 [Janthinobacterium sp.]|nr:hypothetical protein [Janthinobacterium sp.]
MGIALFGELINSSGDASAIRFHGRSSQGESPWETQGIQERFEMLWMGKFDEYISAGDKTWKSAIFNRAGSDAA